MDNLRFGFVHQHGLEANMSDDNDSGTGNHHQATSTTSHKCTYDQLLRTDEHTYEYYANFNEYYVRYFVNLLNNIRRAKVLNELFSFNPDPKNGAGQTRPRV
ncbi:MAG: hypothetical protein FRX48_09017 [Lasallia pustulata]|uniref:Uncharacterized protein n=1 Tax=Lasallia pustulata TaxID=136370 RepID=A0A5M8PDB3_9LECA|nr:MAG: hypothetical protein FRX48_09017 [Lasallia pustulata]